MRATIGSVSLFQSDCDRLCLSQLDFTIQSVLSRAESLFIVLECSSMQAFSVGWAYVLSLVLSWVGLRPQPRTRPYLIATIHTLIQPVQMVLTQRIATLLRFYLLVFTHPLQNSLNWVYVYLSLSTQNKLCQTSDKSNLASCEAHCTCGPLQFDCILICNIQKVDIVCESLRTEEERELEEENIKEKE